MIEVLFPNLREMEYVFMYHQEIRNTTFQSIHSIT